MIHEYPFTLFYVYVLICILLYLLILIFASINLSNQIVPKYMYVLSENYVVCIYIILKEYLLKF